MKKQGLKIKIHHKKLAVNKLGERRVQNTDEFYFLKGMRRLLHVHGYTESSISVF